MATLLTNTQDEELRALQDLYRGTSAPPLGILPEDVVLRLSKVLVAALASQGVTVQVPQAVRYVNSIPWFYWLSLLTTLDSLVDTQPTSGIFTMPQLEVLTLATQKFAYERPEKPMGITDGLARDVARVLFESMPGMEADFLSNSGLTILEAMKANPFVLWVETIRNINSNHTFP